MLSRFHHFMALGFSLIFFALALTLAVLAVQAFTQSFAALTSLTNGLLRSLNTAVIALAAFELGLGVNKAYASRDSEGEILIVLRRTVSRFVSIMCIALVLEGLITVINYGRLELAGNLYYPVAILGSAAALLVALGAFLRLTQSPEVSHETVSAAELTASTGQAVTTANRSGTHAKEHRKLDGRPQ